MAEHKWSGWPGAYCLKCGREDPVEIAIADNWLDPYTGEWLKPQYERAVKAALICPVEDKDATWTIYWTRDKENKHETP